MVNNPPAVGRPGVQSLCWEDHLEKGTATTPEFLPGEFHGQRSLADYSPSGWKEWDMTGQLSLHFTLLKIILKRKNKQQNLHY